MSPSGSPAMLPSLPRRRLTAGDETLMGPWGDGQAEAAEEAAILGMHAVLLESSHPEWCGAWRREQV